MKISDSKYGLLLTIPGIAFIALLVAAPISLLISISFLRYDFMHPIEFYGFKNYDYVLNDRVFSLALPQTIIYSFGTTILNLLIGLISALAVSRIKRFSRFFRTLMILPWAVPMVVSGLVWRWMLDPGVGIVNYLLMQTGIVGAPINVFADPDLAMMGVILASNWVGIPFMFIILLAAIQSIPQDLYESARVDGADSLGTFRHVTLPLIRKSMLTGVLIESMFSFRTIDAIWSMTRGGSRKGNLRFGY